MFAVTITNNLHGYAQLVRPLHQIRDIMDGLYRIFTGLRLDHISNKLLSETFGVYVILRSGGIFAGGKGMARKQRCCKIPIWVSTLLSFPRQFRPLDIILLALNKTLIIGRNL